MHRHDPSTFPSIYVYSCLFLVPLPQPNFELSLCTYYNLGLWCAIFWKIYFCINLSYLPSLYLIVFFCCLLSIVSSSTSLHQKHIYSQHACKIHTFPLFMKIQICVFWMSHVGLQRVGNDWRDLAHAHTCMILSKVSGRNWKLGVSGVPRKRWRADNVKQMIYFISFRAGIRHGGTNSSSSK